MLSYLWIVLLFSLCNSSPNWPPESRVAPLHLFPCCGLFRKLSRCPPPNPKLNYRPVIGILSHPGDGGRISNATNTSYIAASYVKFVESGGARVIPLIYNEPPHILYKKLNLVNGVLFPGGSSKSGLHFDVVHSIFKIVLKRNDAGDHFPLVGICLGFELLAMIVGKDKSILEEFSAKDEASNLHFIRNISGTAFERFPSQLLKKLETDCLVMENHQDGISPERFQKNKDLNTFFKVITTSECRDHRVYVSSVQARRYPITAFQWHPEKNAFEWGLPKIPHSESAIQVTQNVANFFVREARRSMKRPSSSQVLENLIYNHRPTYSGKPGRGFDQVYIFS